MEGGRCYSDLLRYYYDNNTMQCHAFSYGGCQGNSNNFESQQECYQFCAPEQKPIIKKLGIYEAVYLKINKSVEKLIYACFFLVENIIYALFCFINIAAMLYYLL